MHDASMREMALFRDKYLDAAKPLDIVDIGSMDINGCYRGLFDNPGWKYTGFDIEPGSNVDIVGFDNLQMNSYDVLISGSTLEHVKRPWDWLADLKWYIRRGGLICIITHHTWPMHRYPIDTYRYYPDGMLDLFEYAGIEVVEIKRNETDTIGIGKI